MPKVEVAYGPIAKHGRLERLSMALPRLVAQALHAESNQDAHLTENDIVVSFRESGPLDTRRYDIEITILTNDYPERSANLQTERVPALKAAINDLLEGWLSFDVYVLLGTGGWTEHRPTHPSEQELRTFFESRIGKGVEVILHDETLVRGTCISIGCAYGQENRSVNVSVSSRTDYGTDNFPFDTIRRAVPTP